MINTVQYRRTEAQRVIGFMYSTANIHFKTNKYIIMKALHYVLGIALGLILLISIEGLLTMGDAFRWYQYTWFAYVAQVLLVTITICVSIILTETARVESNKTKKV